MDNNNIYCPVCARFLEPQNSDEVKSGLHDGLIYVHDDVKHEDNDIQALENGVN